MTAVAFILHFYSEGVPKPSWFLISWYLAVRSSSKTFFLHRRFPVRRSTVSFGLKISEIVGCFSREAKILDLYPGMRLKISLSAKCPLFLTRTSPPSSKELPGFRFCCRLSSIQLGAWNWCFTGMLRCGVEVVQNRSRRAGIVWMGATRRMDKGNRIRMWTE